MGVSPSGIGASTATGRPRAVTSNVSPDPTRRRYTLKFCRIAEGGLDLYPRFGPTCEWDTAAGQAILEGAGGAVVDPRGRPLRYNLRDTLLNGDFVAIGDPAQPWRDWAEAANGAANA